jgi:hypothetical protein
MRSLAKHRAARPGLQHQAAGHLLDHYRTHRTLPADPAAALLTPQARARLVVRGEWEHRLRLIKIMAAVRQAARRLAAMVGRT